MEKNLPAEFKPSTEIQTMMAELGCTGDKVKSQDIVDRIEEVDFQTVTLAGHKFMYCGIRMKGGFVVVGEPSVCIDPANWRDEIGRQVSFNNTFEQIYKFEAYRKVSA
ncbi:Gp49 family protein [Vibrio parahaemolyticus]